MQINRSIYPVWCWCLDPSTALRFFNPLTYSTSFIVGCSPSCKAVDSMAKAEVLAGWRGKAHRCTVDFDKLCVCVGQVESWLNTLLDTMHSTIHHEFTEAVVTYVWGEGQGTVDLRPPAQVKYCFEILLYLNLHSIYTEQLNQLFGASFCMVLFPLLHKGEPRNEASLFMCIIMWVNIPGLVSFWGGGGGGAPWKVPKKYYVCKATQSGIESMIGRLWYNGSKRLGLRVMICTYVHTVVSRKYAHPRKYTHPPFSRQVVAKGHLLLESTSTLLARRGEEEIALEEVLSKRWD